MVKGIALRPDGRKLLMIGLSFRNLEIFKEQPLDTYITISGAEMDLPFDVMLFSGETEEAMVEVIARMDPPGGTA